MGTTAEKLIRLNQTKADIKAAIEAKSQTVGGIAFSQYANKIRAIKGLPPVTPSSASTTNVTGKLNRLNSTKADIKSAIEACGVPVGTIPFSQYPDKIRAIQTKSTYTGTFTVALTGENIGMSKVAIDEVYSPNGNFIYEHERDTLYDGTYTVDKNEDLEVHVTVRNNDSDRHSVEGNVVEPGESWTFYEPITSISDNQNIDLTYHCEW